MITSCITPLRPSRALPMHSTTLRPLAASGSVHKALAARDASRTTAGVRLHPWQAFSA